MAGQGYRLIHRHVDVFLSARNAWAKGDGMTEATKLWLALSPHGYGHAAMTAPVVAELRRRRPGLHLTIQTTLPRDFLGSRYGADFTLVDEIPDFGFRMVSATDIDRDGSLAAYRVLHADWPAAVEREAARLESARPDLVLANIPYVTIAAAASACIPVIGLASLNWADMGASVFAGMAGHERVVAEMREAYGKATAILRTTPAMDMALPNLRQIGPIARRGADRRSELRMRLGVADGVQVGLIGFGGIDHDAALGHMPQLPGWHWLSTLAAPPRPDVLPWEAGGVPFADLISSVDLVVSKVGYGTFTEAALAGTPVLYVERPDWPESPNLDRWLAAHTRCLAVQANRLFTNEFRGLVESVLALPHRPKAEASGVAEAADILEQALDNSL